MFKYLLSNNRILTINICNYFQFCIPNDRPRYYLLAKRVPLLSSSSTTLGIIRDIPLVDCESSSTSDLLDYLDSNISETTLADFVISDSVLEKPSSWCFDVVLPSSKGTACFTKSYTRLICFMMLISIE